ncbi:MAG TPA: hypothetical protein VE978_17040 [Chitinophagales bacterium]|nr:hypothetical protein [Chitinophagales bacterium]
MKNILIKIISAFIICNLMGTKHIHAQNSPSIAILFIESHGMKFDSATIAGLTGIEIEKTGRYHVMDRYDVADALRKAGIQVSDCRSRECLAAAGKSIHADKILTGSVEPYPNQIFISLRIIDAATGGIEQSIVKEFLVLPDEIGQMIAVTIQSMLNLPVDKELEKSLTQSGQFENSVNNPNESRVNLSGPRTGLTLFTGDIGKAYQIPKEQGGYGMEPWLWNFGWQFETQFVNSGYSQALFEYVFNIAGVEKGRFIPSTTLLLGYRYNKYGLEVAVGPIISIVRKMDASYTDSTGYHEVKFPSPKGEPAFSPGLVIAVGKTFKSGRMNFPVNVFAIPRQEGWSFGLSCGFNVKKEK